MKALIDTNVILDVILHRVPFFDDAHAIFELIEQHRFVACVSSSAMTDIFYLVRREVKDIKIVYSALDKLSSIFTIAPVLETTIKNALSLRWKDFEDAVQYVTAQENKIDCIITRNAADFELSAVACITPADFLSRFATDHQYY
ncbi:twitching motility protein PilT [Campylobacterota bacterium]|nr:twitching motility protein PilT [Campylobacterota bacterium]